ncbi:unnamed protein product [Alopecurus aequalis]
MTPPSSVPDADAAGRQVVKKSMWTSLEDGVLKEQVRIHGPHSWDTICVALPGRNSKSCRLRWCQHLDPRVDSARPFTHQEDMLIIKYQATYGNRWSTIAEFLSGRTDNAIKNRWNSVLRKQHGHASASASDQRLPRQYWSPSAAGAPEPTPGCLPLFPLENGVIPQPSHAPEDDLSEDETSAEPMEYLQLFPLAPGDTRASAGAVASSDMSCGANDPLTVLRLAPAARLVFDVMPLRAYRM